MYISAYNAMYGLVKVGHLYSDTWKRIDAIPNALTKSGDNGISQTMILIY